jgi:hypothetical protein
MLVDETKTDTPVERSSARQALGDAIAAVAVTRERLEEAKRAASAGLERSLELQRQIDALTERAAFGKGQAASAGDDAIRVLLRGDSFETGPSPVEQARHELDALQSQLDALRRARQVADNEIGRRKEALGLAEMRVRRTAAGVLRDSGAAARLLAGLADLERQVVERRLGLRFVLAQDAVPDGDRAAVQALLERNALPTVPAQGDFYRWDCHPSHVAWAEAMKGLQSDPDAPLPI